MIPIHASYWKEGWLLGAIAGAAVWIYSFIAHCPADFSGAPCFAAGVVSSPIIGLLLGMPAAFIGAFLRKKPKRADERLSE